MTAMPNRAAMLSALGASAFAAAVPRSVRAADLQVVNIASALQDDVAPALYGASSGIFARHGLDVRVQPAQSGGAAASAVAGGSLQFAKSGPISLIAGHARGVPFTVVAPSRISTPERPLGQLLVRADSPIKTGKDCNGKIFAGSALNDFNALIALQWIDLNGGDWHSIKLVEVPAPLVIPAIIEGRIDAASAENPVLYDALATGKIRALANPFDSVGKHYIASCWFTSKDLVAKQPDIVRRSSPVCTKRRSMPTRIPRRWQPRSLRSCTMMSRSFRRWGSRPSASTSTVATCSRSSTSHSNSGSSTRASMRANS